MLHLRDEEEYTHQLANQICQSSPFPGTIYARAVGVLGQVMHVILEREALEMNLESTMSILRSYLEELERKPSTKNGPD